MSVMVKTSMMTLMPLPLMLFFTPSNGMMTTLWVTNFARRGAGQLVLLHFLVVRLYTKLAELSALLSSGELAHSPAGWVTLNTLNAYTGRAVPGNFDPQSQTIVDFKPFTLTHQTTPLKLDDQLLQAIVAIDDKNRRRFQIGSHAVSRRKELVIRLTPSAPRSRIGAAPPQSSTTYIPPPTLRPTSPYALSVHSPPLLL